VLSSIRVLRDFELQEDAPTEVMVAPGLAGGRLSWARDRLDGAAGFRVLANQTPTPLLPAWNATSSRGCVPELSNRCAATGPCW
jgi:hypothetical protein